MILHKPKKSGKMKKIVVIDNYDSFTYNLVHYIEKITGEAPDVFRNDEITLDAIDSYDKVLLSPGPGVPRDAGICIGLIKRYAPTKSILGICLGHQAIGESFGARLENLRDVYHGVASPVYQTDNKELLFSGLPSSFLAGRYHSWVVASGGLPDCLRVTATDDNNIVMGISHTEYDVRGLQFHPESILTEHGLAIISNWLSN
jgi:anthranilate synthase component II